MPDTFPSGAVPPSFSMPKKVKPSIRKAQFGDGYSQRSKDGINSLRISWSLNWADLTKSEKDTIEDFLESELGYKAFNWTPPDESTAVLVTCAEWSVDLTGPDVYNVSAEFTKEVL